MKEIKMTRKAIEEMVKDGKNRVTEKEMHEFDIFNNMIKYFSERDVRSMQKTACEYMAKFYAESLRAFIDKNYDRSDNASKQAHQYEVLIACLQRELIGREEAKSGG